MLDSSRTIAVFLSHRYEAPKANLFFFKLLFQKDKVHFEVDRGDFTSVTRIERAVRSAEAFIGIFSLPENIDLDDDDLRKHSRYFRFEMDIAMRARKPGLLFVDDRYGNLIPSVPSMNMQRYDARVFPAGTAAPACDAFRLAFRRLSQQVVALRRLKQQSDRAREAEACDENTIGVLLSARRGYSRPLLQAIRTRLKDRQFSPVDFDDPLSLDGQLQSSLRTLDFAIVDVGDPMSAPLASFLHGAYVPLLRIRKVDKATADEPSDLLQALFGPFEVGYRKDIVAWSDGRGLLKQIDNRLKRIRDTQQLIRTTAEAEAYFQQAAQREEKVFLSYSGKNANFGEALGAALRTRFVDVFNYKEDGSLTASRLWEEELYQKLADCKIGVALYSSEYFKSGHCRKEVAQLANRADSGELSLVGVRLQQDVRIPPHLTPLQNIRGWKYRNNYDALVSEIVRSVDTARAARKEVSS